jgi:hypothetical protein
MLRIDKAELTRMILSKSLEKLPSTRNRGEGYYIEGTSKTYIIGDFVANLRNADTLGWGPIANYGSVVGDSKRYEIARVIIDHHISKLRSVSFGRRLAKDAKEQFVDNIIADFHLFGLFNQQKKELACKVAKILVSEDTAKN